MASIDSTIAKIRTTAATGQCNNGFYRQSELKALHDVLANNANHIQQAIQADSSISNEEAAVEFATTLLAVREHYNEIDPLKLLEAEYRPGKGFDASDQREPWGVVYIDPDLRHTPFFSIITPISAAISAGNCVVLKLENSLREVSSLIRALIAPALSANSFAIVTVTPSNDTLKDFFQVFQTPRDNLSSPGPSLTPPNPNTIAIVDRSADIQTAAQCLGRACFSFRGTSYYSPDIIFVNEFIKKEFLEALIQSTIPYIAGPSGQTNGTPTDAKPRDQITGHLDSLKNDSTWYMNVINSGHLGAIVELVNRTSKIVRLPERFDAPILRITTFTSLEHAIDLASVSGRLSAGFFFAELSHAKYLDQFIPSDVSFVNHVPPHLLLGPLAPTGRPFDVKKRYTIDHFTRATPTFVRLSSDPATSRLNKALGGDRKFAEGMLEVALRPLKERKRPEWVALGFFEQGIFIGLGTFGVPLLGCIGASLIYGVKFGMKRWGVL